MPPRPALLEPIRYGAGALATAAVHAYAAAAIANVALGSGEKLGEKLSDAATAVPDLTAGYRHLRYLHDHREEISAAIEAIQRQAPTPEALEGLARRSADTLERLDAAAGHLARAEASAGQVSAWSPIESAGHLADAAGHLQRAWESLPAQAAVAELATAAGGMGEALSRLVSLDLWPLYAAGLRLADNLAPDELPATIAAALIVVLLAGILTIGLIAYVQRGRAPLRARAGQWLGVRAHRAWWTENLEYALGRSLYAVCDDHFRKKYKIEAKDQG